MPLGSSVEQTKGNLTLQSLDPDKISPQVAGSVIVWTANTTNPNDEDLVYDFFLKGPATNGEIFEKTGWIAENSWTWNTSEEDKGENQVQVWVKRLGAGAAAGYITLVPVVGVAVSALLLHEALDTSLLIGGTLAVLGTAIMQRGRR